MSKDVKKELEKTIEEKVCELIVDNKYDKLYLLDLSKMQFTKTKKGLKILIEGININFLQEEIIILFGYTAIHSQSEQIQKFCSENGLGDFTLLQILEKM